MSFEVPQHRIDIVTRADDQRRPRRTRRAVAGHWRLDGAAKEAAGETPKHPRCPKKDNKQEPHDNGDGSRHPPSLASNDQADYKGHNRHRRGLDDRDEICHG
ncbi:hypothetical protein LQ954_12755 [Sphingomonas sp. IC-11]|nr:hypothetical protein [Sphingomonas sp. IC-11]